MEKSKKFSKYNFMEISQTYRTKDSPFSKIYVFLTKNSLLFLTILGVVFGVILGFSLKCCYLHSNTIILISYPGELFMRILKLMILPLIVASLISGSAGLNAKMNGKIAIRTMIYFVITSFFNAFLGVCLVLLIQTKNQNIKHASEQVIINNRNVNMFDSFLDLGRNIFPDNLFQAAFQQTYTAYISDKSVSISSSFNASGDNIEIVRVLQYRSGVNTLGIVFFCLTFGTVLGTIGSKGQIVIDFFTVIFEVIMKIVTGIMWLTPIGVCSIIAGKILSFDNLDVVLAQLGRFIIIIIIGVFFYQLIVMQLIYFIFIRKNPYKFYWGLIQGTLTASATASTAAALPVTFRLMDEKVKVDPRITRFVLPIGCNINMDGTALFLAVSSIFLAQINNISLEYGDICTVLLISTAVSFSSASVPSAALVLILIVLSSIDVPPHDVSLLFAIDWFVDRIRTTNNMLGDCYAAAVIEHLSKEELKLFNSPEQFEDPNCISTVTTHLNELYKNDTTLQLENTI